MEITRRRWKRHDDDSSSIRKDSLSLYGYITVYRCMGLYMTFCAILSVDFLNLFPRRFVKTETQGYGLMDLGASFSIMAAGLCSSRARRQPGQQSTTQQQPQQHNSWKRTILYRTGPLLFMGILRLIVHGGIEYQEHVSEYGVHWNFFFTLAILSVGPKLVSLIFKQEQNPPSWIIPLVIMILYQLALEYFNLPLQLSTSSATSNANSSSRGEETAQELLVPLKQWIEDAPRHCISNGSGGSGNGGGFAFTTTVKWFFCNFYMANREGLLGCIGYTSLYLSSEWIGHVFVWNNNMSKSTCTTTTTYSFSLLWLLGFGLVLLWRFLVSNKGGLGLECSRRSTNAIFICWTLVVNVLVLSGLQTIHNYYYYCQRNDTCGNENDTDNDTKTNIKKQQQQQQQQGKTAVLVPVVWAAVNRHGLVCFIVANLLTGILNLTIPNMLEISGTTALIIVMIYITAIGLLALLLDKVLTTTTSSTTISRPLHTNISDDSTNAKAKAE